MSKMETNNQYYKKKQKNLDKSVRINIGSGSTNFGKDWIHIDKKKLNHIDSDDIYLRNYKNNSVDLIYSSHFLEYFDRKEALGLLKAWYSKLKINGELILAVPDFKALAELYVLEEVPLHRFLGPLYGKIKVNGETIYHKTVYDYASLGELLRFVGFRRTETGEDIIKNPDSGPIHESIVSNDCSNAKIHRKLISLNIMAKK